jgi:WS/DGAT/MGAT family acyltransferase
MSFDDVSFVRHRLGGSVNDVVLAVVAGAIRHFFKHVRLTDPDAMSFKVMAPVSVRDGGDRGRMGNRVAAWFVPLPIDESDPLERLAHVRRTTAELKQRHDALGAEVFTQALEWMGATPLALGSRLLETSAPFNMVVTNVPGPRNTLYLLSAPMIEAHPMVPLMGNLSVGIALFSYGRNISWGFNADWDLVPDLHELVRAVEQAFEQLLQRAKETPEAAVSADAGKQPSAKRSRKARGAK